MYAWTARERVTLVRAELPELPVENIVGEPVGRDTATVCAVACAVLSAADPEAVVVFTTADSILEPPSEFQRALDIAHQAVASGASLMASLGVTPHMPSTEYGYLRRGAQMPLLNDAHFVTEFVEKPDVSRAAWFTGSAEFLWNTGTYVVKARDFLDLVAQYAPKTHAASLRIADVWSLDSRDSIMSTTYRGVPSISIDAGVIEPAVNSGSAQLGVIRLDAKWLDLGSWEAYASILHADPYGNQIRATTALVDAERNVIVSDDDDHLIAAIGVNDAIIIHTADATLVCPKQCADRIKDLVRHLDTTPKSRFT